MHGTPMPTSATTCSGPIHLWLRANNAPCATLRGHGLPFPAIGSPSVGYSLKLAASYDISKHSGRTKSGSTNPTRLAFLEQGKVLAQHWKL
jgi:hypothetical protein